MCSSDLSGEAGDNVGISGEAGDNVGILLRGIERDQVERGQVLAKPLDIYSKG